MRADPYYLQKSSFTESADPEEEAVREKGQCMLRNTADKWCQPRPIIGGEQVALSRAR